MSGLKNCWFVIKPLFFFKDWTDVHRWLWFMHGGWAEKKSVASQESRERSVWVRDSDPDWSQRRDQGAGGVTRDWHSVVTVDNVTQRADHVTRDRDINSGVQLRSEPVKSCLCYFKMGKTVSCCKLSTRGFVSTLLQWKFLKSFIKYTYNNKQH